MQNCAVWRPKPATVARCWPRSRIETDGPCSRCFVSSRTGEQNCKLQATSCQLQATSFSIPQDAERLNHGLGRFLEFQIADLPVFEPALSHPPPHQRHEGKQS